MSRYVIELRPDCKVVQQICESNGQVCIGARSIQYLEELTADYINEHFGDLHDEAYKRGLEDGKAQAERGCKGCLYNDSTKEHSVCNICRNAYLNRWTAKPQEDNEIKVGDEVNWLGDCFIVTRIFQPRNMKGQCDGIDDDGCTYRDVLMDDLEKTGRHFDISKILEDMRND